ncbi:MAG: purine-binding chemotaxis protein CheW [Candidatus Atribacteria bacterium]|nr:purine-binding chemotaxis protein CheW [Candidatus Atribacteria bacterium]
MDFKKTSNRSRELQLVAFMLGEETYGVDISQVEEIIRFQPVTRVPGAPDFVEGVINLRGRVIPVIDLRKRFNLGQKELTKSTRVMVVEVSPHTVGMIVDAVDEVLRINEEQIEPPSPLIASIDAEYIQGVGKLEDKLIILLDLSSVLSKEETEDLTRLEKESQEIINEEES